MQLLRFNVLASAPDPTVIDLSGAVAGVPIQARTVRVTASTTTATTLLIGGVDTTYPMRMYCGVLIYGFVAAGSSSFTVMGSVLLPSTGAGVTALSQTSAFHPGYVLASTDQGVYKCAISCEMLCGRVPCRHGVNTKSVERLVLYV